MSLTALIGVETAAPRHYDVGPRPIEERSEATWHVYVRRPQRKRVRQLLFRHLFYEGDGYLGLQSRVNLPCRTLSSPTGIWRT
jgi:hypothetical protein